MYTGIPVGMAIQITPENSNKIAIVNGGFEPLDEGFYTGSYFIVPFDPELTTSIVPGYVFEANWVFMRQPSPNYFVRIAEI